MTEQLMSLKIYTYFIIHIIYYIIYIFNYIFTFICVYVCVYIYVCSFGMGSSSCVSYLVQDFSPTFTLGVNFTSGLSLPFEQSPLYLGVTYENYISQNPLVRS